MSSPTLAVPVPATGLEPSEFQFPRPTALPSAPHTVELFGSKMVFTYPTLERAHESALEEGTVDESPDRDGDRCIRYRGDVIGVLRVATAEEARRRL